MYHERQLMVYELYIGTISAVVAAIFFGIISAMLAIINTGSNPVEAICHVPGQYRMNQTRSRQGQARKLMVGWDGGVTTRFY